MSLLSVAMEKRYRSGTTIRAEFVRPAGEFSATVLFGPSRCGKTTVLRSLAGLETPQRGRIQFGDEVWFDAASREFVGPQQRGVGYLSQDYALFPHMNVAANVGYGLHDVVREERRRRVGEVLELLQLRGLEERQPGQLSGGEQQRVALARAV
ncbi:MAG TPA: ATP-binding cassette domain-containing protein, partial [Lacipirellulaceae bacterium]|nr:ATP-binding cassette domain-containing protein [Lacipirellulaceae bacterium]